MKIFKAISTVVTSKMPLFEPFELCDEQDEIPPGDIVVFLHTIDSSSVPQLGPKAHLYNIHHMLAVHNGRIVSIPFWASAGEKDLFSMIREFLEEL